MTSLRSWTVMDWTSMTCPRASNSAGVRRLPQLDKLSGMRLLLWCARADRVSAAKRSPEHHTDDSWVEQGHPASTGSEQEQYLVRHAFASACRTDTGAH